MNATQPQTTFATIIAFAAGILAGRGVFGWDAATWTAILGAAVGLGAAIYQAVITRKAAMVSAVAAMPEVSSVTLDKSAPGTAALNEATPSNVVSK